MRGWVPGAYQGLTGVSVVRPRAARSPTKASKFFGQGDPHILTELLRELVALARHARTKDEHLYCWVCVQSELGRLVGAKQRWLWVPGAGNVSAVILAGVIEGARRMAGWDLPGGKGMSEQQPPPDIVWALATAGFAARCLHVVSDLGVADHIGDQPVVISELAASCGVDRDALDRVLRLLTTHGIFERQQGGYGHTPSSRLLRSDHPRTMRPFAQMMGLPFIWGSVTELKHSVQTGKPAVEILEPKGVFAYLQDRPDEAEIFGRAMTAKASADIGAVIAAYDFTSFGRIADIGGGRGHLLRAVLQAAPSADGILFDLPVVIDTLSAGDQPRLTLQAGDFFVEALPSADAYVLMEVLHDWPDEQCVAILSAIRRAAPHNATVLVVEDLLPEDQAGSGASTLDVIMLTVTGGRERTVDQLGHLFDRAGFVLTGVIDTPSSVHIVEAKLG